MPDVRSIDLTNGIRIDGCGKIVEINAATIIAYPGNQAKKQERLNQALQQQYERRYPLSDYDLDHPVHTNPAGLPPWRRVEASEVIETKMFVQAHIYSLSPPKITLRCQDAEAGPITGEWW